METKIESRTNRQYLEGLAKEKDVYTAVADEMFNTLRVNEPLSVEEAKIYPVFWTSVFDEFKDNIKEIEFAYQEKGKELPLSKGKNLLRKLGCNIKPKIKKGDIKLERVTPELVHYINHNESFISLATQEEEWKRLNAIWNDGGIGFSAPYILTMEPLCYRVNIHCGNISKITFKPENFLNGEYKGEN